MPEISISIQMPSMGKMSADAMPMKKPMMMEEHVQHIEQLLGAMDRLTAIVKKQMAQGQQRPFWADDLAKAFSARSMPSSMTMQMPEEMREHMQRIEEAMAKTKTAQLPPAFYQQMDRLVEAMHKVRPRTTATNFA